MVFRGLAGLLLKTLSFPPLLRGLTHSRTEKEQDPDAMVSFSSLCFSPYF